MNIHECCRQGDLQRLRQLIVEGVDLNATNFQKGTALHVACGYLHVKIVEELLKYNVALLDKTDDADLTPLHYACMPAIAPFCGSYQLKIVQMLIDHGAAVNVLCTRYTFPGIRLDRNGNTAGIANEQSYHRCTLLHVASLYNNFDLVKLLLPYSDRSLTTATGEKASDLCINQEIRDLIENYQDIPTIKEPDSQ